MPLNRRSGNYFPRVGGGNERHSRAARGGSTRRQRRAPCCDAQHRAKPEAQVLRGKELNQKDTNSSSKSWRPGNRGYRIKMAKKEIKLAWAQKMGSKEALVVRLLVNPRTSCKVEDTCSLAVRSLDCGREVQRAAEEKERQVASVMAEAVEGPVGSQVTAGSWKRGWRGSATCSG